MHLWRWLTGYIGNDTGDDEVSYSNSDDDGEIDDEDDDGGNDKADNHYVATMIILFHFSCRHQSFTPGPGTYGVGGVPQRAVEEKCQQSTSTKGMLDSGDRKRNLPSVVCTSWKQKWECL